MYPLSGNVCSALGRFIECKMLNRMNYAETSVYTCDVCVNAHSFVWINQNVELFKYNFHLVY